LNVQIHPIESVGVLIWKTYQRPGINQHLILAEKLTGTPPAE